MRGEHLDGSAAGKLRNKEQAMINLEKAKAREAECERLVAEGKMRKITIHPNSHTTINHYEKIE